jgi:arginyl-tRNA synthetase
MNLEEFLNQPVQKAVQTIFDISPEKIEFQLTRKDFEGDITLVVFPLLKETRLKLEIELELF